MQTDTIAAISTPLGEGGIGAVRISGEDAFKIAKKVFKPINNKDIEKMSGYTAAFGKVYDGDELLDEGVLLVFRAPKSYTGENVVEISVHGGTHLIRKVLRAVISAGARLAEGGEFTKRAFLNGKMSLTEAESVMSLISAKSDRALNIATRNKNGALSNKIKSMTDKLLYLVSQISVFSDFPEDETLCISEDDFLVSLKDIEKGLDSLIADYDKGRLIIEGINTVIVGSPNAGKSTLMNLLSKTQRSIVTSIAGTTRDVVEQTAKVGDYILFLADTAGIHETDDEVEQIGIKQALSRLNTADLCLAVFDTSVPVTEDDKKILEQIKGKNTLLVLNKNDLETSFNEYYESLGIPFVKISALTGSGEEDLVNAITELLKLGELDQNAEMLSNERQYQRVLKAKNSINEAISALESGVTLDAVGILIDDGLSSLLELDGKKITVEVADEVFKNFCVGK
ncbi:MAG: tRNA uridine-5-carboxymethylaminomethyl(34) synthesis GTPase MnmE [Acutalibacteraceae bacterium]|nr:tRNA uridine-5-carboxymethylaminomethyl(34) synthesis GTPase MnmE [Acutalibacteraceae bacterium]